MIPRAVATLISTALTAVAFAAAVGCGSSTSATATSPEHPTVDTPWNVPNASDAGEAEDAPDSTATAASHQGNPLCNASHSTGSCYPDDPATAKSCGATPDGGAYSLQTILACHVTVVTGAALAATSGLGVEPACSAPGSGGEGAACAQPSDCSAGNECVGAGVCRHYCCAGDSACLADEFCDIQPLAQSPETKVPVCMPIRTCELLAAGTDPAACPATSTCAVVRDENGETGCLPIGTARAGESCATEYCGRGLTCIGTSSKRVCYTLCHTASPVECSSGQACVGGLPMFPDPAFGICD